MGFFSELKSDLSTADNENAAQEAGESTDLDSMLNSLEGSADPEPVAQVAESAAGEAQAAETEAPEDDFLSKLSQALGTDNGQEASAEAPAQEAPVQEAQAYDFSAAPAFGASQGAPEFAPETQETAYGSEGGFKMEMDMELQSGAPATDESAVITSGMTVNGDVSTTGNLELMGKVAGNVRANGKLTISGEIVGDSAAAEIYAESARITGEVRSQGSVKIGQSTVIIGNIYANGAVIAGAVKGDIDVHGPVILDTTAIVMGNIKSQSVQINNGAVIEGMCSQVYAEVNPSAFFDNLRSVDN